MNIINAISMPKTVLISLFIVAAHLLATINGLQHESSFYPENSLDEDPISYPVDSSSPEEEESEFDEDNEVQSSDQVCPPGHKFYSIG